MKWPVVKLGEVCEFKYGKSLPAGQRDGGGFPVYGSNGIVGWHSKPLTGGPTIVVGRKGSFGEVAYSPGACWPIDTTYYIDSSSTKSDLKWLSYRLKGLGLTSLNRAAAIPGLNREDAYRQELQLPPLDEQRRIAEILDQVDALRATRRRALCQVDDLSRSIFLDMFGNPMTNPKGWPVIAIERVCDLVRGSSPRPQGDPRFFGGPVPRLMISDITRDGKLVTPRTDSLTVEGAKRSRPCPRGTVVMAVSGNIGLASMLAVDACIHDGFVGFTHLDQAVLRPRFLLEVLSESKAAHDQSQAGAIFKNITTTDIKRMEVISPPLDVQVEFANRVRAVEHVGDFSQQAAAELDALSSSLYTRAFAGEI